MQLQQDVHILQPNLKAVVAGEVQMGQLLGRAECRWYRLETVSLQVQHCDGLQVAAPRKALQIRTQC